MLQRLRIPEPNKLQAMDCSRISPSAVSMFRNCMILGLCHLCFSIRLQ
jgi:hypothetical protein